MIIAIAGKKGVGKSFVSDALKDGFEEKFGKGSVYVTCFAEDLKKFCHEVLGLPEEAIYGDDLKKNTLSEYSWDNFPDKIRRGRCGLMTCREVLQTMGSEIMRDMFSSNVWIKGTISRINKKKAPISIINDLRFINEINAVKSNNGYVWNVVGPHRGDQRYKNDTHQTEKDLNPDLFDFIINNGPDENPGTIFNQVKHSTLGLILPL
jgi:hypothetical protein